VAVSLSQPAQVYAGQGKSVEAEPVYLQALKIYQIVHGDFHAGVVVMLNNLRASIACTASMPGRRPC
jgi:hypothetical protein